ncbi:MAG: RHS repeat-associated core domain-containing protein [bacterium]
MTQRTDGKGTFNYLYEQDTGRLEEVQVGTQTVKTFTRTEVDGTVSVTRSTKVDANEFYSTTYSNTLLSNGGEHVETLFPGSTAYPDKLITSAEQDKDGRTELTFPDGSRTITWKGPDPLFGMQAPIVERMIIQTPDQIDADDLSDPNNVDRFEVSSSVERTGFTDPIDPRTWTVLTRTVEVNGRRFTTEFDRNVSTWTTTSPALRTTTTTVDAQNRVTSRQVTGLYPVFYSYDDQGRIEQITRGAGPDAREWRYTYHPTDGYLAALTSPLAASDAVAGTTSYGARDGAWRPTAVTLPGNDELSLDYDGNGNVTGVTPPASQAHGFDYTDVNLTGAYYPPTLVADEHAATTYAYRLDRKLETVSHRVYAAGVDSSDPSSTPLWTVTAVDRTYNADGRLSGATVLSGHGSSQTSYAYGYTYRYEDPAEVGGVQVKTIDVTGAGGEGLRLTYGYDGFWLNSTSWGPVPGYQGTGVSGTVSQSYNADYQVSSRTVSAGGDVSTIDFHHDLTVDADGLLTSATHATAGEITLTRDPGHGLVTGTTMQSGGASLSTTHTISGFGELDRLTASFVVAETEELFDEHVTERDAIGRIVRKTEAVLGVPRDYFYKYDPSGRLLYVCEETAGPLCSGDVPPDPADQVIEQYSYGVNGNRASAFVAGVSNVLITDYDAQDRLLTYGGNTYAWTPDGRLHTKTSPSPVDPAEDDVTTYAYDVHGNLRTVEIVPFSGPPTTISYVIDGRNRRVGKKVNGQLVQAFLYKDGLNPVAELSVSAAGVVDGIASRFVYASRAHVPDFMIKGGNTYRLVTDHLGSVRLVVNVANGDIAQRLDYDAFGRVDPSTRTNPGFQPFGFAGGIQDADTGLVRFGARDYDPEVGRWTTKDPILMAKGEFLVYGYVLGDPVNRVDPIGLGTDAQYDIAGQGCIDPATKQWIGQRYSEPEPDNKEGGWGFTVSISPETIGWGITAAIACIFDRSKVICNYGAKIAVGHLIRDIAYSWQSWEPFEPDRIEPADNPQWKWECNNNYCGPRYIPSPYPSP